MRKILLTTLALATFGISDANAQCSVNTQPSTYCGSPDAIMSFTLNGIPTVGNNGCNNSSNGYTFFATPIRQLAPGGTYSFSATTGTFPEGFAIWIDLNGNGFFENSEQLYTSTTPGSTHSGSITIPVTASGAQVRMRTKCHYNSNPSAGDACANVTWGETEDYWVSLCKPPVLTAHPIDTFACEGGSTIFSMSATGAGNYQWQINNGAGWADVTNGTNFSGATTATLTIQNAPTIMNQTEYRCIAMASCSNFVRDTTNTAILTVLPNTNIVKHTLTDTSCIGLQTKMYVKNDGVILNRRWQIWSNIEQKYVDVPSVPFTNLGDTLLVQNIPDTLNGALIRCIVEGMCGSDTTGDIRMVVNALPEIVTSPADVTTEPGKTVEFQVVAAGVGIKYQWQAGYKDTFANINEGGIYKGVKTDRLSVAGVSRVQDGFQFRCIIRGSGSCDVLPDTSNFGLLFVDPPASVGGVAAGSALVIFPNPASGNSILVKMENNPVGQFSYHVIDKVGRVVSTGSLNSTGITNIDITSLTPGIYSVQIIDKDGGNVSAPSRFTRL